MNKQEFLKKLRKALTGIPKADLEERLLFYSEMIDDRMDEGAAEDEAIAGLGSIESIAAQVISEISLTKLVKEKVKPSRSLRAWEIVLLVLGSPIWLSLLVAAVAIVISIYAVIWAVLISLWAVEASLAACAAGSVFACVVFIAQGSVISGIATIGAGLVCAGLGIFGFWICKCATGVIVKLTKYIFLRIKSLFLSKEAAK